MHLEHHTQPRFPDAGKREQRVSISNQRIDPLIRKNKLRPFWDRLQRRVPEATISQTFEDEETHFTVHGCAKAIEGIEGQLRTLREEIEIAINTPPSHILDWWEKAGQIHELKQQEKKLRRIQQKITQWKEMIEAVLEGKRTVPQTKVDHRRRGRLAARLPAKLRKVVAKDRKRKPYFREFNPKGTPGSFAGLNQKYRPTDGHRRKKPETLLNRQFRPDPPAPPLDYPIEPKKHKFDTWGDALQARFAEIQASL